MRKIIFASCLLSVMALWLVACQGTANALPAEVKTAVKTTWDRYQVGEYARGGGWNIQPGDATQPFEIIQAEKGTIPNELKVLMSTATSKYLGDVWCISFRPTLHLNDYPDIVIENMLFFPRSDGTVPELRNVWNERWVTFLYDPGVYKVSTNAYFGPLKSMFEKMGCSNWQGK